MAAQDKLVSASSDQTDAAIDLSTTPDLDLRAAPRYPCRHVRVTRILAKPSFQCLLGYIRDISTTGICVRCAEVIPAGSRVAINWQFGDPQRQRTLLARVVHATLGADSVWSLGCAFETALTEDDLADLLSR